MIYLFYLLFKKGVYLMSIIISKFKYFVSNILHQDEKLSIRQITKRNLPFFIGWIAIIVWLDCYVLPVGIVNKIPAFSKILPSSILSFLYPIAAIVILILFNIRKLLPYAKYSSFIAMIGILTGIILGNSPISYFAFGLAAVGLGHIFTTTAYGFFMILNNSEKLYSVSMGILFSKIILLTKANFAQDKGTFRLSFFQMQKPNFSYCIFL